MNVHNPEQYQTAWRELKVLKIAIAEKHWSVQHVVAVLKEGLPEDTTFSPQESMYILSSLVELFGLIHSFQIFAELVLEHIVTYE